MKVRITHLKAPWPAGASVGDVAQFDGGIAAWAVGKCVPVGEDVPVTATPLPAPPEVEAAPKKGRRA